MSASTTVWLVCLGVASGGARGLSSWTVLKDHSPQCSGDLVVAGIKPWASTCNAWTSTLELWAHEPIMITIRKGARALQVSPPESPSQTTAWVFCPFSGLGT